MKIIVATRGRNEENMMGKTYLYVLRIIIIIIIMIIEAGYTER
jgi:hypothetical protein